MKMENIQCTLSETKKEHVDNSLSSNIENKPVLFLCSTYFQLMTSINMKLKKCKNRPADLLLTDTSDFSELLDNIKKCNTFRNVFQCRVTERMIFLSTLSLDERIENTDPVALYEHVGLPNDYSDLYMTFTRLSCSLYYYFVRKGGAVRVHLYEDGPTSYSLALERKMNTDGLVHEQYGEQWLGNHIVENLFYAPELYCGPEYPWPVRPIGKPNDNLMLHGIMDAIFGHEDLPSERYIFFGEFHAGMLLGSLYSDFLIVEKVAAVVGKENIAVKLHPRCPVDRFTPAGYKVMQNQRFPWEIVLFGQCLDDKVLLTIRSTSVITPLTLFEQKNKVICFANLVRGSDVLFWGDAYTQKLLNVFNASEKTICFPKTEQELIEYIHYFEGRRKLCSN